MPQAADAASLDVDRVHVEELHLRQRPAIEPLEQLLGVRPLNLVAVVPADDRLAARMRWRALVAGGLDLVAAGLRVELDPVHGGSAPDEQQLVLIEIEKDAVADHVAVVAARHHLLRLVRREVGEAVDRKVGRQPQGVGTGNRHLRHVVRLIVEHDGLLPADLLAAPVAELDRNDGIDVSPHLRVAQQVDDVA